MIIAPSLLASDFGRFAQEALRVENSGADWLHLDIMDGHFVPNLSFGPKVVATLRKQIDLFFDVHLMCSRPEILLEPFVAAGADQLTVHVELGVEKVSALIWKIKALGKKVGIAVNPPTPVGHLEPFLKQAHTVLVMTVNPGFGGQEFIHETVPKVQQAALWKKERKMNYHIEVDGGIAMETAAECARAGADAFVSGTALFAQRNMKAAVKRMRKVVAEAMRET